MNGLERLLMLQESNRVAGELMSSIRPRFEAIRNRAIEGTAPRAVTGFNLFQTPRTIAQRMAQIIRERAGDDCRILEPSAGLGRLFEPLEALRAEWIMVEEVGECCNALRKSLNRIKEVRQADFLDQTADGLGGKFDCVVMNPPFKQGRDIKHILHALEMVRDGGRLVSLCYNGTRQNEKLKPYATRWEVLPEGSFKEEGTAASVALLVIDK
jgi:predicted RNA methylase